VARSSSSAPSAGADGTTWSSCARTDQFCFCVAFHEALYGERPFAAASLAELRREVAAGRVKPAPTGSAVPPWLRDVVLRGLSVRPEDRFPSMEALLAALPADPEAEHSFSERARAVGAGVGLLLLLITNGYTRLFRRTPAQEEQLLDGRMVIGWVLFTLAVVVPVGFALRKRLLANRVARQTMAALMVIYYVSIFAIYAAHRLGLPRPAAETFSTLWASTGLVVMGIVLLRMYLWVGLAGIACAVVGVARARDTTTLYQVFLLCAMSAMIIAWARPRRRRGGPG
jgi:hypothetical protein